MGKRKVYCEGQPGMAEDSTFPNIAGVKWREMGFLLRLGSQTSMVSGFGWDGVNFPGSNHYTAVLCTCSYNGVGNR